LRENSISMTTTEKAAAAKRLTEKAKMIEPTFWQFLLSPKTYKRKSELFRKLHQRSAELQLEVFFEISATAFQTIQAMQNLMRLKNQKQFPSGGITPKVIGSAHVDGGEYIINASKN